MPPSAVPDAEPADRRAGLILFGVLDLVLAVPFLIRALVYAFLAISGTNPTPEIALPGEMVVWAAVAFALAAFFVAIAFGSMAGRRWARSLSVAFSALWLVFGTLAVVCILAAVPGIASGTGRRPPPGVFALLAVAGIALPAAYLLFYRSAGVRAACEWLDPEERWTDRIPVVVLAAAMLLAAGAVLSLGVGFSSTRQRIFFGEVLGAGYRLAFLGAALLQLLTGWGLLRRRRWAGAGAVAVLAARAVADVVIVRGLTIDRIERAASSIRRLGPQDRAQLDALRSMRLEAPITAWVAAAGAISVAIAVLAGRRLSSGK